MVTEPPAQDEVSHREVVGVMITGSEDEVTVNIDRRSAIRYRTRVDCISVCSEV